MMVVNGDSIFNHPCIILFQMFERETKREKILETRQRELRLKERTQSQQAGGEEERGTVEPQYNAVLGSIELPSHCNKSLREYTTMINLKQFL